MPIKSNQLMMKFLQTLWEAIRGNENQDFTTGSINKAIFLLSVPMIIEMLGEGLFAIVDAYFVSKVSNEAFATVMFTETFATLIYSVAIGISIAAAAMVSRRIGEKNPDAGAKAAAQAIMIAIGISVFISIFGIIFAKDILQLMGADEAVIAIGVPYTQILLGGNVVIMLLFILNGIFRGAGDATMAMRSLWIANSINIVLDPLLIFGIGIFPEMGIIGAAIATTIGRGIGVIFQLYILFKGKRIINLKRSYFVPNPEVIKKILNISITGTGQFLISSASWIVLMIIISKFGTDTVNGYGLSIRIIMFTILPAWGISNAAATLMGQNLGAKLPDRAATSVWRSAYFNAIFLLVIAIFYYIWAEPLISIFNDNEVVIEAGVLSLRIFSIGYVFFGFGMVLNQSFGGAGDTRTPTILNFVCFWMVEIPLAYALVYHFETGPEGVYWSILVAELLLVILAIYIFRQGKWKTIEL